MTVTLCVMLWAAPGGEQHLVEYEDQVLGLLPAHGARLVMRVRNQAAATEPYEAHVIEFPSDAALDAYMADPTRAALSGLREQGIARTEVLRVDVVTPPA